MGADLQPMALGSGSLGAYAPAAGADAIERIRALAEPLGGARVLHVSSAGAGRRVPDLLGASLPLMADAGVAVSWRVLFGGEDLTAVAAALRDGLQGAETAIDDAAWDAYAQACAQVAQALPDHDLLVLHDPGPLGVALAAGGAVAWRCHVDASRPDGPTWDRARTAAERCAPIAVPAGSFAPPELGETRELSPGIDPLNVRNLEHAPRLAGHVLRPLGLDLDHPFAVQVLALDRWKDPHETLDAFALARDELADLQLVLAADLGEDWSGLKELSDYVDGADGVLLLTSYSGVGNLELGALQRVARVALQRALREGFGLAASEALWKGTPVVGGQDGGIPLQVRDGVDGYLTESADETAGRLVELVRDPGLAIDMGRAGQERVRERFLVTSSVEQELRLLRDTLRA